MNRRDFCLHSTGTTAGLASLALAASGPALAQGAPVEGTHYVKLSQPLPVAGSGKIEVVEFFWYGCPHCNSLEPALEQWLKRLPADVNFRRAPVAFSPQHEVHQRLYFALEASGLLESLHRKVFNAIHVEKKRLLSDPDISAFISAQGQDGAKFLDTMKSFGVQTKARQARQLSEGYRIDGVPAIGVQGRFYTSSAMAGGHERTFAVADYLIGLARR